MRTAIRTTPALWLALILLWAGGPVFAAASSATSPSISISSRPRTSATPKGGDILEAVHEDGAVTRLPKRLGYFGAFNPDRTIRIFVIPVDGICYFQRQARRPR